MIIDLIVGFVCYTSSNASRYATVGDASDSVRFVVLLGGVVKLQLLRNRDRLDAALVLKAALAHRTIQRGIHVISLCGFRRNILSWSFEKFVKATAGILIIELVVDRIIIVKLLRRSSNTVSQIKCCLFFAKVLFMWSRRLLIGAKDRILVRGCFVLTTVWNWGSIEIVNVYIELSRLMSTRSNSVLLNIDHVVFDHVVHGLNVSILLTE